MSQTPESPGDSGSALKRTSRKSHRKSRNGCLNCKQRRIKCGEQKPACSNCLKHSSRCSFLRELLPSDSPESVIQHVRLAPLAPSPRSRSPSSLPGTNTSTARTCTVLLDVAPPRDNQSPSWNLADLELLHNYDTSTSYTLATIPAMQTFLRLNVPRMAFSNPFLLHTILAISALHLAHFKKDLRDHYLNLAHHHYNTALPTATSLLEAINEKTCSALYMFSTLCTLFTLGMGPKPGDFLVFGEQGISEWLVLFRGMRTIIESHPGILENSDLSPMFSISIRQFSQPASKNPHLEALRLLIIDRASEMTNSQVYLTALDELERSFPSSSAPSQTSPQIIFVWLYRLSDDFVHRLQQRDPIALVILAHFCVLLNGLSSFWWINGWVEHLLSAIYRSLDAEHRMWISWPMEEIGWIPS